MSIPAIEPSHIYKKLSKVLKFSEIIWYLNNVLKIVDMALHTYKYRYKIFTDPAKHVYVIVFEDESGNVVFVDITSCEDPRPYLEHLALPSTVIEKYYSLWKRARDYVETMSRTIAFKPLKPFDMRDLEIAMAAVKEVFPRFIIKELEPMEIPSEAYDPGRNQYRAEIVLDALEKVKRDTSCDFLIGFTSADIYSGNLNFVFSLQNKPIEPSIAVFSTARLHNSFYGAEEVPEVTRERIRKQLLHIVYHHLGLPDCPNSRCVMAYVNSVMDVDSKTMDLCTLCKALLIKNYMYKILVGESRVLGEQYIM